VNISSALVVVAGDEDVFIRFRDGPALTFLVISAVEADSDCSVECTVHGERVVTHGFPASSDVLTSTGLRDVVESLFRTRYPKCASALFFGAVLASDVADTPLRMTADHFS